MEKSGKDKFECLTRLEAKAPFVTTHFRYLKHGPRYREVIGQPCKYEECISILLHKQVFFVCPPPGLWFQSPYGNLSAFSFLPPLAGHEPQFYDFSCPKTLRELKLSAQIQHVARQIMPSRRYL